MTLIIHSVTQQTFVSPDGVKGVRLGGSAEEGCLVLHQYKSASPAETSDITHPIKG